MRLVVGDSNPRARAFYERLGSLPQRPIRMEGFHVGEPYRPRHVTIVTREISDASGPWMHEIRNRCFG